MKRIMAFGAALACASIVLASPAMAADLDENQITNEEALQLLQEDPDFANYYYESQQDLEEALSQPPADPNVQQYQERTANPHPNHDQRIGTLWWRTHESWFGNKSTRVCTANHIGGRWWITAHHCLQHDGTRIGFIETSDGSYAGIEKFFTRSDHDDIALIRVGSGLTNKPSFTLASDTLNVGDEFQVNGFAGKNSFSSKSDFKKTDHNQVVEYNTGERYIGITVATLADQGDRYRTLGGDSGGACYVGNTLYGIHSGSNVVVDVFYSSYIAKHKDWIESVINNNQHSNAADSWYAFHGGSAANSDRRLGLRTSAPRGHIVGSS